MLKITREKQHPGGAHEGQRRRDTGKRPAVGRILANNYDVARGSMFWACDDDPPRAGFSCGADGAVDEPLARQHNRSLVDAVKARPATTRQHDRIERRERESRTVGHGVTNSTSTTSPGRTSAREASTRA